jgi:hypothetical protein
MTNKLNTPWTLAWDRDGTEDFGTIYDADGHEIVSSQHSKTCWLPEEGEPIPQLVRQLWLMETAPKLLAMLKIAVATADPAKHRWVKEAWEVIAAATGQPFDAKKA